MDLGSWFLNLGSWFLVLNSWFMVPDSIFPSFFLDFGKKLAVGNNKPINKSRQQSSNSKPDPPGTTKFILIKRGKIQTPIIKQHTYNLEYNGENETQKKNGFQNC